MRAETATRLQHALGALSPDEQTVLRMAYYDDKSQTRISGELGIPLGTVKSRVRLAFARLRAALTRSGPFVMTASHHVSDELLIAYEAGVARRRLEPCGRHPSVGQCPTC